MGNSYCKNHSRNAICTLPKQNGISGIIHFHQCTPYDNVNVCFTLYGPPESTNAIHIHEYGDMSDGCNSLGPHFNPYGQTHGSPKYPEATRHVGDLINNITFDKKGNFFFEYSDPLLSLMPNDPANIIGRSIVIHSGKDDLGQGVGDARKESLISGNAGKRIQCGIIALSMTKHF